MVKQEGIRSTKSSELVLICNRLVGSAASQIAGGLGKISVNDLDFTLYITAACIRFNDVLLAEEEVLANLLNELKPEVTYTGQVNTWLTLVILICCSKYTTPSFVIVSKLAILCWENGLLSPLEMTHLPLI